MSKTLEKAESRFTLHVEPGSFRGAEMIGLLGENGCGKYGRLTQNQNARLVFWGTLDEATPLSPVLTCAIGKTTFMEMMAGAFDKRADGSEDKSMEVLGIFFELSQSI